MGLDKFVSAFRKYSQSGVMHMAGADPISRAGGVNSWKILGQTVDMARDNSVSLGSFTAPSLFEAGLFAAGVMGTGSALYQGYQDNGAWGAASNLSIETAISSALFANSYQLLKDGNQMNFVPGRASTGKILSRIPGGKIAGSVLNYSHYASKFAMSTSLAYGASSLLGGGVVGTAAGWGAAYLGAKYSGVGYLGLAAAGAAYGTYKGVSAMMKMGNEWTQSKKRIDTDGTMAAFMSQGAHTMRARAVMAMQNSHLNARSALGQEANILHRPYANYNSRYR